MLRKPVTRVVEPRHSYRARSTGDVRFGPGNNLRSLDETVKRAVAAKPSSFSSGLCVSADARELRSQICARMVGLTGCDGVKKSQIRIL
jgi:hypothetical protein